MVQRTRDPVKRVTASWSTGKDSAWSLHRVRSDPAAEVATLDGEVLLAEGAPRGSYR